MIVESRGMEDCYFTWIEVVYALPADDSNMIVTVKDRAGTHIEMGFYDGTGWYGYDGNKLNQEERSELNQEGRAVIAWACVYPYEKSRHEHDPKEEA